MSSYLNAFAVGRLAYVEETVNNVRYRVYSAPSYNNQLDFALQTTVLGVEYFEELFQLNYTFNKLDSIAVPERGGAMENWGLITYGTFLHVTNSTPLANQRTAGNTVSK